MFLARHVISKAARPTHISRFGVASFSSGSVDQFLQGAVEKAQITNAADDLKKIANHNITTVNALKALTVDDFNHMGVSVGVRLAILDSLEEQERDAHQISRSHSYSSKDRKARAL